MQEEWRKTKYRGYRVSNLGRVRSVPRTVRAKNGCIKHLRGKVLKHGLSGPQRDYHSVVMPGGKTRLVHILVCTAFHGPKPGPKYEVNHIDGDKDNNRADNLEWTTHKGNMEHASRTGLASGGSLKGSINPKAKLTEADVLFIRSKLTNAGRKKPKLRAKIMKQFGIARVALHRLLTRRTWSHI